jgi:hypothetical protein
MFHVVVELAAAGYAKKVKPYTNDPDNSINSDHADIHDPVFIYPEMIK